VRLWWSEIPKGLPLPAVFVGVDVFHAPMAYDPVNKKRGRKASCAAIIVQIIRKDSASGPTRMEIYSKTYSRSGGEEYQLGDALQETVAYSLRLLKVEPKSVVVWRDGIGESAEHHAIEEINGVRRGLNTTTVGTQAQGPVVPLAYICCQKRIATKLLTSDGKNGAPAGTMVTGLQALTQQTFYINGRAPPYSTPKPVRYVCIQRDQGLNNVPLGELTWGQCHEYPNWAGPIKVPSVCQMAHKLAELAGSFSDGGETIDAAAYKNRVYFL
jgi:Piwi domain